MRTVSEDVNIRKITLAAEMYYIYDMSQKQIAERLGVSRPWVSKLLKRAKETGIVRIDINSPLAGMPEVEQRIMNKYRINRVTVIRPMVNGDYTNISMAAANYLVSHIRPDDTIGVSWGTSIASMIDHVVEMQLPKVTLVPIVGGAGSDADCLSNVCTNRLANILGAQCHLIHVNACCADQKEYQVMMSNQGIKDVIEKGEHANLVLVGIGDVAHSRIMEYDYVTEKDREDIEKAGVVGDIGFRFFDKGGEVADIDFNKRVVACDLSAMRKNAREVIAIAYGSHKAEAIKAALKGGLITTLFTDYETARILAEY